MWEQSFDHVHEFASDGDQAPNMRGKKKLLLGVEMKQNRNGSVHVKGVVHLKWKFHPFTTHHDVDGGFGDIF